ncbi:MAG: MBL fold metallo-hydrolase [Candidatus Solibacter sp.]|jgi:beta-lactamase superfamily II metal-dependent hydrolase
MKRLLLLGLCALTCFSQELRVYAIDVEGGKSTLYVSPSGQSMLVDAGYAGFQNRDAGRIVAAAKAAGVTQIDYLVITHYHVDHVGGVPQLAARMPIRNFVDHGENFEAVKDTGSVYPDYLAVRAKGKHIVVKAGDRIPIAGIDVEVVTASGTAIEKPLPGAGQPNPLCASYPPIEPDTGENAHSIGMVISYGKFRLVDLGDLHWNRERDLACPNNLLGTADVYMTTHHAKKTSGMPAMVYALGPKAAIMNNGPKLGGVDSSWQALHDSPGTPDIWQLHYALMNDRAHNSPDSFIANRSEDCTGYWIRLAARADGSFTIQNGRTQVEKAYR